MIPLDSHKKLYPTVDQPPRFYGLPKVHKKNTLLRPIVSSFGTITYKCAKYLAGVMSPLMGKTIHFVKDSKDFAEYVKTVKVGPDEELRSYDVSALFTSVPVDKAMVIIKRRLQDDVTLAKRTPLSPDDIVMMLEQCLKCTYFLYKGEYYLQIHGAAMGSPVSPIVCNIYMEEFEQKALAGADNPPRWWKRYVDDTYTVLKKHQAQAFTDYLNTVDEDIKWTTEGEVLKDIEVEDNEKKVERCLAFLDTLSVINEDGSIRTRVFRKDTHTDQYLNFNSNHPLEHKRGVVRTLTHRAKTVVSDLEERKKELEHVGRALGYNEYPEWMLAETREAPDDEREGVTDEESVTTDRRKEESRKKPVVIPYIRGVSEQLRRIFGAFGVPTYFKPTNTLRQLLVHPKDPVGKEKVVGPVYNIKCEDCEASYIGETERSLKARFGEHRRPSSTTSEVSRHIHTDSPSHTIMLENTKILSVEPKWFQRGVKESIYIRALKPSLNKDGGRYNLPPIWNNIIRKRLTERDTGTTEGGARSDF